MSKFNEVEDNVIEMMDDLIKGYFPTIVNARIKVLYNMVKKSSKGALILGQMAKTTPILNYLTSTDDSGDNGYNYIMFLDGNVFPHLDIEDKKRVVRHELNHISIDLDAKDPYKVVGHEIEDFYKEIEYNSNDTRWKERVFAITDSIYNSDEEIKGKATDGQEEDEE